MKHAMPVALVAAVLGVGLAGARYRATSGVTPYGLAHRPLSEVAQEGSALGMTPVKVGTLTALIRRPSSGHAWFLYWGGNTSTYFKEALLTVKGLKLPADIGVLVVAPPGYDSAGRPSPQGIERDAALARDWLRQHEGAERIVSGGFSMGVYSALVAAERDVAATVILGAAMVFEASEASPLIRLYEPDRYQVRVKPPRVPGLVIQGELDDLQQGREVAAWLGARLVVVPGAGHVESSQHPAALAQASAFIQQSLR